MAKAKKQTSRGRNRIARAWPRDRITRSGTRQKNWPIKSRGEEGRQESRPHSKARREAVRSLRPLAPHRDSTGSAPACSREFRVPEVSILKRALGDLNIPAGEVLGDVAGTRCWSAGVSNPCSQRATNTKLNMYLGAEAFDRIFAGAEFVEASKGFLHVKVKSEYHARQLTRECVNVLALVAQDILGERIATVDVSPRGGNRTSI
jgi:hypothetical protein